MTKQFFIKLIWYNEIGHSKVIARLWGVIPQVMMVFTFLKVYGIALRVWQMLLIGLIWYILGIICGIIYTHFNLLRIETQLLNEHNPLFQKIEKDLCQESRK